VQAFSSTEFTPNMITALPYGYGASQVAAEHPNAQYETFHRCLVAEMARPKSMPVNKAMADSSDASYASGRLDHLGYYAHLDSDRAECDAQVLEPLFEVWFEEAVLEFGWTVPENYTCYFDWPQHAVIDALTEAQANQYKIQTGELSLGSLYAANGEDFNASIERMAREYGVEVAELRKTLFINAFNAKNQQASYMTAVANASKAAQPPEKQQQEEGEDASAVTAA